jgi:hypothetical protein
MRFQKTGKKRPKVHWASTGHETQFTTKICYYTEFALSFLFLNALKPITAPAMCTVAINIVARLVH